jgi:NAD(P)-dependent dehydrogenase (short-subunit alcohol dehydrogenase family)
MQSQAGGAIVNISTFAAFEPDLAFPVSSSLRAALGAFTKLFADRYAADGIRMNSVLPGYVDSYPTTPPFGRRSRCSATGSSKSWLSPFGFCFPMRRGI